MDLRQRILDIEKRLHTLETASRLRSASISEGITEITEEGVVSIDGGGTVIIDNGGKLEGKSWSIGVDEDGGSFAELGDVLIMDQDSPVATKSLEITPLQASPNLSVDVQRSSTTTETILLGTINILALPNINCVVRVDTPSSNLSFVVPPGQSVTIPIMEKYTGDRVTVEVKTTKKYYGISRMRLIDEVVPE